MSERRQREGEKKNSHVGAREVESALSPLRCFSSLTPFICGSTEGQHYHKITLHPPLHPITLSQPINQDAGVMAAGGVVAVVTWRILVWV